MATYELHNSRRTKYDHERSSQSRSYVIDDAVDEDDARTKVEATAPVTVVVDGFTLPRVVTVQSLDGEELYSGRAEYRYISNNNTAADGSGDKVVPTDPGESSYSFDYSGRMEHVDFALGPQPAASYLPDGSLDVAEVVKIGNLINKRPDDVLGTDKLVPQGTYRETHIFAPGFVTQAWVASVGKLIGYTNSADFRQYTKEELLFSQFSGQRTQSGDWQITFGWAIQETELMVDVNLTNPNTGAAVVRTFPEKRGWRYLHYRLDVMHNAPGKEVGLYTVGAAIAQLYPTANFAAAIGI